MQFDVPFLPDDDYVRFLDQHRRHLNSVYFSLYQNAIMDARHRFGSLAPADLIQLLKSMTGMPKFALVNSRAHHPADYLDTQKIGLVADILLRFAQNDVLDGIVFADAYYLQALSDLAPDLAAKLQAVPSINFMIDTADKLCAMLDFISTTHFRSPARVFLDRSLNRNPDRLATVVAWSRKERPRLKIGLLANEGCLYQCPFKPAHDCLIACSYMNMHIDTFRLNQAVGCMQILRKNPQKLFQSPFIRPEDVGRYEGLVDELKLCGRTLGPEFLRRVVQAFIDENYKGNLLDLLDASNWMADEVYLANERLPEDFLRKLTTCSKNCRHCDICHEYQNAYMHPKAAGFRDLRTSKGMA